MNWTFRYKIRRFIFAASQIQLNCPTGQAGLAEHLRDQSHPNRCRSPSISTARLVQILFAERFWE
jgi:BarA-like signal transduction histidine kinase